MGGLLTSWLLKRPELYNIFMNGAALHLLLRAVLRVFHYAFQSSYKM